MSDRDQLAEWVSAVGGQPDRMMRLLGVLTADEMRRFADGTLNILILIDMEFSRRFPEEYRAWQKATE